MEVLNHTPLNAYDIYNVLNFSIGEELVEGLEKISFKRSPNVKSKVFFPEEKRTYRANKVYFDKNTHNDSEKSIEINFLTDAKFNRRLDEYLWLIFTETNRASKILYHNMLEEAFLQYNESECSAMLNLGEIEDPFRPNKIVIKKPDISKLIAVNNGTFRKGDYQNIIGFIDDVIKSNLKRTFFSNSTSNVSIIGIPEKAQDSQYDAVTVRVDVKTKQIIILAANFFLQMLQSEKCQTIPVTMITVVPDGGHDIFFLVDKKEREIQFFDSNGISSDEINSLVKFVLHCIAVKLINSQSPYKITNSGETNFTCQAKLFDDPVWSGSCQVWAQIVRDINVVFPPEERLEATQVLQNLDPHGGNQLGSIDMLRHYCSMRIHYVLNTIVHDLLQNSTVHCGVFFNHLYDAPKPARKRVKVNDWRYFYNWATGKFFVHCNGQVKLQTRFYIDNLALYCTAGFLNGQVPLFYAILVTYIKEELTKFDVVIPGRDSERLDIRTGEYLIKDIINDAEMAKKMMPIVYTCLVRYFEETDSDNVYGGTIRSHLQAISQTFLTMTIRVRYDQRNAPPVLY